MRVLCDMLPPMARPRIAALAPMLAGVLTLGLAIDAHAQRLPDGFRDSVLVSGLDTPIAMEFLPDGRLLVAEQNSGAVRLVVNGVLSATDPVLVVDHLATGGERGLLGVAIDPQFPSRPYLYTHETSDDSKIHVTRWTLTGDLGFTSDGHLSASSASRFEVIADIPDNASNHNGGTVRFGPDGLLYVSVGEDAEPCASQVIDNLQGKILCLDVSGLPAGAGAATHAQVVPPTHPYTGTNASLVFAYGLRNPFRFQIDALSQTLVIADVGQSAWEEIDLLGISSPALPGAASGGANFGWPWREGNAVGSTCGGSEPTSVRPAYAFDRGALGAAAIISGGVYQPRPFAPRNFADFYGSNIFFSEYYSGVLVRLTWQATHWGLAPDVSGQPAAGVWADGYDAVSDWRVGPDGALWYCRQFGGSVGTIGFIHPSGGGTTPPPASPPFTLRAGALPAHDAVTFTFGPVSGDAAVTIRDASGRRVRTLLDAASGAAAERQAVWDGRDDAGRALPAGVYWATARSGGRERDLKFVWLR